MTKPQSTAAYVLRLTLTLFLITVIVAGLLAFVNYLTADTIAEHTAEAARSAMTQVLAADDYTELPVSDAQAATGVTAAWSAGLFTAFESVHILFCFRSWDILCEGWYEA